MVESLPTFYRSRGKKIPGAGQNLKMDRLLNTAYVNKEPDIHYPAIRLAGYPATSVSCSIHNKTITLPREYRLKDFWLAPACWRIKYI